MVGLVVTAAVSALCLSGLAPAVAQERSSGDASTASAASLSDRKSGKQSGGKDSRRKKEGKRAPAAPVRVEAPIRPIGTLTPANFGIHSYQGKPGLSSGSYRHNCYPLWRTLNPAPGVYDWTTGDQIIDESIAMGFRDVMFSFCGTPSWAARTPVINPAREYWGEDSTAAPRDMSDWRRFLRDFVTRYGSRISMYEAWNEATAQYLWQGTPDEMAQMTQILHEVVSELDPTAKVISANSQMGEQPAWFRSFFPKYMAALAARGWPVDVVSIHTYAGHPSKIPPEEGVVKRALVLDEFVAAVKAARIPSRVELWDTETNYLGKAAPRLQQALVLRTYLDSWRHGIKRTYWYMWVKERYPWLGIQMMDGEPGVTAYNTLMKWTVGAKFRGCAQVDDIYLCEFVRSGKTFRLAYSVDYTTRQKLQLEKPTTVCEPTGSPCLSGKRKVTVTYMPVKIG